MTRRRQPSDDEIIVLDSIGTPALSFAVPAALRLLKSQINNIRQARPRLKAINGGNNGKTSIATTAEETR